MPSINKAILIGHIGRDPEVKQGKNGNFATFSLATTSKYNGAEQTEWHNISVFGKLADVVAKYCTKGMAVYVEGRLRTRQWEKDGQKHYTTEVICDTLQMLGGGSEPRSEKPKATTKSDPEDDLPF